jgi:hypothetical protein
MAEAMTSFVKQRWLGLSLFLLAATLAIQMHLRHLGTMPRLSYLTGWVLFGLILALTLYNARKKLPFVPLLSSEAWLQFHIYAGLLTGVLFAMHVSYRVPTGWFEGILAWLYALVMLSGFFGLFISRTIPQRLTTRGGEVLFERIPAIRRQLQERAEALALKSIPEVKFTTIADFYARELKDFFEDTRNVWLHLFEVRTPLNRLLNKITDLNRYLNEQERAALDQIAALVRQKDGLDYHYALQLTLKLWLFTHIPLTYSLLLFALAHIVLVFAFSGGAT